MDTPLTVCKLIQADPLYLHCRNNSVMVRDLIIIEQIEAVGIEIAAITERQVLCRQVNNSRVAFIPTSQSAFARHTPLL